MILPAPFHSYWATAVVNHLWQSTIFIVAAWLLTIALRRNQARTRYFLWMFASVKFLVPFSILIAAGEWLRPATPLAGPAPALLNVMGGFTQPLSISQGVAQGVALKHAASSLTGASAVAANRVDLLLIALLAIWILGTCFLLARWAWRWRSLRRVVRTASPVTLNCGLPVLSTRLHLEPGVFGVLHPVLLLPEGIRERLSEAQLDTIIAHELFHVRRRDNLTAILHMLVEAAFWFYPPVWWIGTRLLEERERACDEAVLESRREPLAYAEGILSVCKSYVEAPVSCVSGVTGSDLKKRIMRIMAHQVVHRLDFSRKLLLGLVAMFLIGVPVTVGVLHAAGRQAQTAPAETGIVGTWQGTLHVPQGADLRTVVKITGTSPTDLKVTLYSIDQGGQGIPATTVSFQDGVLKYEIQFIDGSYEGKISADGRSISGTWKQGPLSLTLVLERATPETEWTIPAPPPKIPPMAADANPSFEVATIKPSKPGQPGKIFTLHGAHFITINTTLLDLITFAYDVQQKQVVGGPDWMSSDKFDIDGEPDIPGLPAESQARGMLQKLLADRFALKFHREAKTMSAYVLTVAKNGPKLEKSADQNGLPGLFFPQLGVLNVMNATMGDFASLMQTTALDRPVVDQTGLQGKWNFTLKWTPDESQFSGLGMKVPPPSDAADAPPPLFTAIQEQIGLKLEAGKAPVPVLVLDHVEQPSAN